ncbi:hypothetical protein ERO13_D10G146600v2 [Gossypium hirsutum]|uniref:glutathione transferase n=4 Tax=Gossypium TaxID=3633 RepID=A0A1U8KAQ5_GOSHI|nr:probable glutathione S-transferase [Gossypium hirsutum]KAB2009374.1 hypothetical protein ES319_D10G162300v1 [Gossypium barbadense]KAG4126281.1 hypothetical protein ERO13_D10G146600v2 [Gossypium hirsutum]TYG50410.1 hypothetical protein ES288_D10G173300v1 [Gossypium darwinii]TYH50009.1 hypothetical protein ES332_D10G175900v1 [Gossypium tomentosum]
MAEVKLHGFWSSPFSHRVIWALKIKGVNYEYIEEDLSNKSELLLKYNPVYKKIPVLVHGGEPIAESLVILEYIEETWPNNPLLPIDPYDKAIARFWIQFGVDKGPIFSDFFRSTGGEEQEKTTKELLEALKIIEEQALGDKKFFGGNAINLVDISYGMIAYWFKIMEEVIEVNVLEPNTLPRLCQWAQNFMEVPVIKENIPERYKVLAYLRHIRQKLLLEHLNK